MAADQAVALDRDQGLKHARELLASHPHGYDVVVEATGQPRICDKVLRYAHQGGQLIVYGVYPEAARISLSPDEIFRREFTIKESCPQTHFFDRALLYLESGKLKVDEIVTQEFALEDYGLALDAFRSRVGIKSAVIP